MMITMDIEGEINKKNKVRDREDDDLTSPAKVVRYSRQLMQTLNTPVHPFHPSHLSCLRDLAVPTALHRGSS